MADDIDDIIAGNTKFKRAFEADKAFYQGLAAAKQTPKLLWIGCADSRVDPAQIIGAGLGDIFVIRNIANIVPPANSGDDSVGAAIEYALNHLEVDDIVVCGHAGCGGVKALSSALPLSEAHLNRWVDFARVSHALIEAAKLPEQDQLDATIKANVLFQQDRLFTYPAVLQAYAAGKLRIHGWFYDMLTADLLAYDERFGDWRPLGEAKPKGGV